MGQSLVTARNAASQNLRKRVIAASEKSMKENEAFQKQVLQTTQPQNDDKQGIEPTVANSMTKFTPDYLTHPHLLQESDKANLKEQEKQAQEMPKDLIDFLNDIGPVERKVNKKLTSPRYMKNLKDNYGEAAGIKQDESFRHNQKQALEDANLIKQLDEEKDRLTEEELFLFLSEASSNIIHNNTVPRGKSNIDTTNHISNNSRDCQIDEGTVRAVLRNVGIPKINRRRSTEDLIVTWSFKNASQLVKSGRGDDDLLDFIEQPKKRTEKKVEETNII